MTVRQITSCGMGREAVTKEKILSVHKELPDERLVESNVVNLYPDYEEQEIEGFGGAMTETSAYLLMQMKPERRREALDQLFGGNGLNLNLIRVSIDSCDYSLTQYQAVADPLADPELATFSIDRDRKYVIPALREAMAAAARAGHEIRVLMSPWSPPWQWKTPPAERKNDDAVYGALPGQAKAVSKTSQRCNGGSLKPEFYGAWARYMVRYVSAYLDEGIPVTMLSLQNETVAATEWDSCVWTAEDAKRFLKEYLYPEMERRGLAGKIGIWIWDHNKERMIEHVDRVLAQDVLHMVEGIAFHWYSGDHFEAVDLIRRRFPQKKLMLSECCALHPPGKKHQSFLPEEIFHTPERINEEDAEAYAHDIIGNLNGGMNRWIDWNLVVDEEGRPRHVDSGFTSGLIAEYADEDAVHTENHFLHPRRVGGFHTLLMYDYIRHFSGFIEAGAKRIGFSRYADHLDVTAAKNPDGSLICVLLNRTEKDSGCFLRVRGTITKVFLPRHSISTVVME